MRKRAYVLAVSVLVAVMLSLCVMAVMVGVSQQAGVDTLIVADANEPATFDPALAYDYASWAQLSNIYETLVAFRGSDAQNVYPCLATSWKISSDAKNYTFSLRRGVVFSNGDRFTASCVKYSFERVIAKAEPDGPGWILADFIDKVVVLDLYTVRIDLKSPYSGFLANLASVPASIVDPAVVQSYGDEWMASHTVGTGPYTLKEWVRGKQVELRSNERWWGWASVTSRTHLRTVVTKIVPDIDERVAMIVNGAVDIARIDQHSFEVRSRFPVLGYLQGIEVESQAAFGSHFFVMSNKFPPFDDKTVRQAVSHAFNYDEYVTEVLKGLHVRSQGMIPNGMFAHVNDLPIRSYDPDKAKTLLLGSNHPGGCLITIAYPTNRPYTERARKTLELMRENLISIGWAEPIEVVGLTTQEMNRRIRDGEVQMIIWGWLMDYPDPDNFVYCLAHSNGFFAGCAGYSNATVDGWVVQARSTPDPETRKSLCRQIELQVFEDAPYVFLHQQVNYFARREWVKGIVLNPALCNALQFSQIRKEYT